MNNLELTRQFAVLRGLIRRAGHETSTRDLEMLAHWGKYACVLTSGFVENVVRLTYGDFIQRTSSSRTAQSARRHIEGVQNPKHSKLIEIAGYFDKSWATDLGTYLGENFRKEAIDAIMANRHQIVHGRNSGITLARVDQYLSRTVEFAEFIEGQCGH